MVMQGIAETNNQFLEAISRGDAAGCASVYPDDGKVLPTNSPMIIGKQGIQQFWQAVIDMGVKSATLQTVELEEHGDTAIEIGAYTLIIEPDGAEPMKDAGKYVVVWKKQPDGSWKWAVDIFNTDLAPS